MNNNGATAELFGLRPRQPKPHEIPRVYETVEPIIIPRSSQPLEEAESSSLSSISTLPPLRCASVASFERETPFTLPTAEEKAKILSNLGSESPEEESSPESPSKALQENAQRVGLSSPETAPSTSSAASSKRKGKRRTSSPQDGAGIPEYPFTEGSKEQKTFWKASCRTVRRGGKVELRDLVDFFMTRKGGVNIDWPQLREAEQAVANMRKGTFDIEKIKRKIADEETEKQRKEERRLANKRRYRPRSEWAKEKAAQKAAASLKRSRDDEETLPMDKGEPTAKRSRLGAADGPSAIIAHQTLSSLKRPREDANAEDTNETASPRKIISLKRPRNDTDSVAVKETEEEQKAEEVEPTAKRLRFGSAN